MSEVSEREAHAEMLARLTEGVRRTAQAGLPLSGHDYSLLMDGGNDWKRGLPPGKYYEDMLTDYEVYFAPMGWKWHRKRTAEQREYATAFKCWRKALNWSATP